jgi:DNA-binding transcriptional MocR family regulator
MRPPRATPSGSSETRKPASRTATKRGLASALGISVQEVTEAVDYLENRKDMVRFPTLWKRRPREVLKPDRGWVSLRDEVVGGASAG